MISTAFHTVSKMAAIEVALEENVSLPCSPRRAEQPRRRRPRRTWVLQKREHSEFHRLLQELRLDDGRFQQFHRLSISQFEQLLSRVGPSIARQDTNYRRSIPPDERLAICLRFLATGDTYRTIATTLRLGFSTVCHVVARVATAIWDCLVDEYMSKPSTEDWRSIAEGFQERWTFPLCCGALDGRHVQIKAPPSSASAYTNYMGTTSIVLLAVVDATYRFRVIDVGAYGGGGNGGILANSTFGQNLKAGTLHLPPDQPLPGAEERGPQPYAFVADEAFPLRRDVMRPFPGRVLPLEKKIFNYRLSRARLVAENAFEILSSQWRVYGRSMEYHPEVVEKCVKATCVLHNFLQCLDERGETTGGGSAPPVAQPLPGLDCAPPGNYSREAVQVREKFMAHFSAEGAVAWQPRE